MHPLSHDPHVFLFADSSLSFVPTLADIQSFDDSCLVGLPCHHSLFLHIFSPFLSNFKPSFFHFTCSQFTNNKTRHKTSSYWYKDNKHRLHCTQDGLPQDSLTASSYHLITDQWTLKGHVVLLDSPLCHQLVDQPMLVNHILDLTGFYQFHDNMKLGGSYQIKIGPNIMIQLRTHYLRHLQLSPGCDS